MVYTRNEIIRLLENYKDERQAIETTLKNIVKESDALMYPGQPADNVRVQSGFSQAALMDSLIHRCEQSRQYYLNTLKDMKQTTATLDRLLFNVNRLPGKLKVLVLDIMIGGESIKSYAIKVDRSVETVSRMKNKAIDLVYSSMNKTRIGVSHAES